MKHLIVSALLLMFWAPGVVRAQAPVLLEIGAVDTVQSTFEIVMTNTVPVAGFQFEVTFGPSGPVIVSTSGGSAEAAGFSLSNSDSMVLGFSLSLAEIAPGSEVLTVVTFDCSNCLETPQICLSNAVFADIQANSIPTDIGPCFGAYPWVDLGGGTVGSDGPVTLVGTGSLESGTTAGIHLTNAPPGAAMVAWISFAPTPFSALNGTVHAFPFSSQLFFVASFTGSFSGATTWPPGIPPGTDIWFQFVVQDLTLVEGATLSNGVQATTP